MWKWWCQWLLPGERGAFNFPISYQNTPYIGLATGSGHANSSLPITREIDIDDNNTFTISSQYKDPDYNGGSSFTLFIGYWLCQWLIKDNNVVVDGDTFKIPYPVSFTTSVFTKLAIVGDYTQHNAWVAEISARDINGIMENNFLSEIWLYTYNVPYDSIDCRITSGGLFIYVIGI